MKKPTPNNPIPFHEQNIIEPIGFMIQGDSIIVANPCTIPLSMLEDVIKEHRKKANTKDVTALPLLIISLKFVYGQKRYVIDRT